MCFNQMTELFSALLTPMLGIITVIILIRQDHLERLHWKLALYDKRYLVFLSTMKYISEIIQSCTITTDQSTEFSRNSRDKEFLFGDDVKGFLNELGHKGLDIRRMSQLVETNISNEEREKLIETRRKLFEWFQQQFKITPQLFGKYLRIDKK